MVYRQQAPATRTRFDFEAAAVIIAKQRRAERKRLRRLLKVKRAAHFVGFLSFWAVALSIGYVLTLATLAMFISLT